MASDEQTPPRLVLQAARAIELIDGYKLQSPPQRHGQSGWLIEAELSGLLPSRRRGTVPSADQIGNEETVSFLFSDLNADKAPSVHLRPDFPKQIHHFTERAGLLGPSPCLTAESLDDFYYSAGFIGILYQLRTWLLKAATDKLSNSEDGWEATPTFSASVLISEHTRLRGTNDPELKDRAWAYVAYRCEPFPAGSLFQYHLSAGEAYDPSSEAPAAGCFGGIHFHTAVNLPPISTHFNPEDITNAGELADLVKMLGVNSTQFVTALTTVVSQALQIRAQKSIDGDILVPVSFLVPRPHNVAGTDSPLELFCFVVVWKSQWKADRAATNFECAEVLLGRFLPDGATATRARLSGFDTQCKFDLAGAGSLGSKIALSLCRAGWVCTAIYDPDITLPHNAARYGVPFPNDKPVPKRRVLQGAINCFQSENIDLGDDALSIDYSVRQGADIPEFLISTTADNRVSDTLASAALDQYPGRLIDASLMLGGSVGLLIIEGENRSPTYNDMFCLAMLRMSCIDGLGKAIISEQSGFDRIDVGGGCGTFTMVASDASISTMAGLISDELLHFGDKTSNNVERKSGYAVLWNKHPVSGAIDRIEVSSAPFSVISCLESPWSVRLSPTVVAEMERAQKLTPGVETGGYLLGHVSERRKEICVVALIPPPQDSVASPSQITLGTAGVRDIVRSISTATAGHLIDVGTWHSHLQDSPPSHTDHKLVSDLAMEQERLLPYAMIVRTPERFHAVLADPVS